MSTKISGDTGIDVAQLRPADGDPVAMTIAADGKVSFPQNAVPAVSRTLATGQGLTAGQFNKLNMNGAVYEFGNGWNVPNNEYTPTVAGLYLVTCTVSINSVTVDSVLSIFKNNVRTKDIGGGVGSGWMSGACVIEMNGTTDAIYPAVFAASAVLTGDTGNLQITLLRAA